MNKVIAYPHHRELMWVQEALRGGHREHCLCWTCARFKKDTTSKCPIADELFELCVKHKVVTPVWECTKYCISLTNVFTEASGLLWRRQLSRVEIAHWLWMASSEKRAGQIEDFSSLARDPLMYPMTLYGVPVSIVMRDTPAVSFVSDYDLTK